MKTGKNEWDRIGKHMIESRDDEKWEYVTCNNTFTNSLVSFMGLSGLNSGDRTGVAWCSTARGFDDSMIR